MTEGGSGERKPLIFMGGLSDLPSQEAGGSPWTCTYKPGPKTLAHFVRSFPQLYFQNLEAEKVLAFCNIYLLCIYVLCVEPFESDWQAS